MCVLCGVVVVMVVPACVHACVRACVRECVCVCVCVCVFIAGGRCQNSRYGELLSSKIHDCNYVCIIVMMWNIIVNIYFFTQLCRSKQHERHIITIMSTEPSGKMLFFLLLHSLLTYLFQLVLNHRDMSIFALTFGVYMRAKYSNKSKSDSLSRWQILHFMPEHDWKER